MNNTKLRTAHEIFVKAASKAINKYVAEDEELRRIARQSYLAADIFWAENLERDTAKTGR